MLKKLFFVLLCIITMSFSVLAQDEEWVSKKYPFQNIKTITVVIVYPNNSVHDISKRVIPEITTEKLQLNNVRILTMSDINHFLEQNGYEFNKHSEKEIMEEQVKMIRERSDATLFISVAGYGMGTEYVEGSTVTYNSTTTSYITGTRGNIIGYMETPTANQITIPGGDVETAFAYIEFNLYDNKTQDVIFARKDYREKPNVRRFDNTTPKDLYKRILGTISNKINDLKGV